MLLLTSVPHPNVPPRDDDELVELRSIVGEHVIEALNPEIDLREVAEPEQDDASVRTTLPNRHLAEIAITRDHNSIFGNREAEHIVIWQPSRIVAGYTGGVVSLRSKVRLYSSIGALVKQKSHADAA
jgi:hypothetical protein